RIGSYTSPFVMEKLTSRFYFNPKRFLCNYYAQFHLSAPCGAPNPALLAHPCERTTPGNLRAPCGHLRRLPVCREVPVDSSLVLLARRLIHYGLDIAQPIKVIDGSCNRVAVYLK